MPSFAAALVPDPRDAGVVVRRMLEASPHRGTVGEIVQAGVCALGVTRREDLPETSVAQDSGWAAAVAGPIDNAGDLARDLMLAPDASDATVVVHLVRRHGPGALVRLRGYFGLAVTDGTSLYAARDHVGGRGVFFVDEGERVFVASDARQVLAGAGRTAEPDLDVVASIVYKDYESDTPTAFRGVRRLQKAQMLHADGRRVRTSRYWHPERVLETATFTTSEIKERFDDVLTVASRRSLTGADVVSLSGGIDSPVVAAYAAPEHLALTGRPLPALSVVYPEYPEIDESKYIEEVADFLGMPVTTYEESAKALDGVEDLSRVLNGPISGYFLGESAEHYQRARQLGYRSTLTGELVEWVVSRRDQLLPYLLLRGRWAAVRHEIAEQRALGRRPRALIRQAAIGIAPPRLEAAWARIRPATVPTPPWVDDRRLREVSGRFAVPARRRWPEYQLALFRGAGVSEEAQDVLEEWCGVRTRRPFADVDVCEFFLSLPAEIKFPSSHRKGLLIDLVRGRVPDVILDRTDKTYFNRAGLARADYAKMKRYLVSPSVRIPGIDYRVLSERLEVGDLPINEYQWAKNLAAVHAFLSQWEGS